MYFPLKRVVILAVFVGFLVCMGFVSFAYDNHQTVKSAVVSAQEAVHSFTSKPPEVPESYHHNWKEVQQQEKFAYVQYATDRDYLCNAIINFARLKALGTKYDRVLIYPNNWDHEEKERWNNAAIRRVRTHFPGIKFRPADLLVAKKGDTTWVAGLTKFHAFELTDYSRVLAFDSDSLVLNNMDHYFSAPRAAVAVPRAYWLNEANTTVGDQVLGSHVMLLEPKQTRYQQLVDEADRTGDLDMEVVNHMFKSSAMILPHRGLALLTGEFRSADHSKYLAGDDDDKWDAAAEAASAYLVHFSDWPLPKPWVHHSEEQWNAALPKCPGDAERKRTTTQRRRDCPDRTVWTGFYEDYRVEKDLQCQFLVD